MASAVWNTAALSNVIRPSLLLACVQTLTGQCNQGERRRPLLCKWDAVERGLDSFPGSIAVAVFWRRGSSYTEQSELSAVKCCWFVTYATERTLCAAPSVQGFSQENMKKCDSECDYYSCGGWQVYHSLYYYRVTKARSHYSLFIKWVYLIICSIILFTMSVLSSVVKSSKFCFYSIKSQQSCLKKLYIQVGLDHAL